MDNKLRRRYFASTCAAAFLAFSPGAYGPACRGEPATSGQIEGSRGAGGGSIPVLFDGFEGPALADFWLPGNYGSGLYVPGAIRISTNYARSGGHSVEITVHDGDIEAAGDGGTQVERAELDSGHFALRGREAWYGFSMLIPKGFPIVDDRLVISSCKQSDVSRPIVAQRYQNGNHTLTVESQGRRERFDLPAIARGKWIDMIYRVRYSAGEDGLVQVWMNGKPVAAYAGPTAEADAKNAFYSKIGLYRDRFAEPMTMYFDNYSMGGSRETVDPARVK